MGVEIERKFLVDMAKWRPKDEGMRVRQGYLADGATLLARVRTQDEKAFLTLKGRNEGVTRAEFDYEIPKADAEELLALCERPPIEKTRHVERVGSHIWEIDVFAGENEGLVMAEVELASEDELFDRPEWVGPEVSDDARYYNSNLAKLPYSMWDKGSGDYPQGAFDCPRKRKLNLAVNEK